ncbi:hypothetical protein BBJ28_00021773 [Nothophytophthora sp. Chile5]|nr:hypothetical protein BBJ28_00021773 [Nothophytophthora sp. Chile5]
MTPLLRLDTIAASHAALLLLVAGAASAWLGMTDERQGGLWIFSVLLLLLLQQLWWRFKWNRLEESGDVTQRPGAEAAAAVLRSGELFRLIMTFKRGLPNLVVEFKRENMDEWLDEVGPLDKHPSSGLLPKLAIHKNDFRVFRMLHGLQAFSYYRSDPTLQFGDVRRFAAVNDRLDILKYFNSHAETDPSSRWSPHLLNDAIYAGKLRVVRWLLANRPESCASLTTKAVDSTATGNLALLQFLHEEMDVAFTTKAMNLAAENGRLDIVRFLHEKRTEGCTRRAMDAAARNGHLEVVKFLHKHRSEGCTTKAMDCAARNGHLAVVKFLHDHREEGCTTIAMDAAAQYNRMDVIQFLRTHRHEGCTEWAMAGAAVNGHLDMVRYLHQELHVKHIGSSASIAAQNGHYQVFDYLCTNYPVSAHRYVS